MKIKITTSVVLLCRALATAVLLSAAPGIANAQVYSGTSAGGTIVLSNFSSPEARVLLIPSSSVDKVVLDFGSAPSEKNSEIPKAFKALVEEAARQHGLDPNLLHAMIRVESGYNPRALSAKGARGLMQLMPETARRFGVSDAFNPRENVRAGAEYVQWLLKLFQGDVELALAGYNAGEQAVIRAGYRIPSYGETQKYVPKVLAHYK
ncbi:lytic transglycosylase domain-containing protein [Collimonas sp.]|jgi:soluble lytic murein transglycosylase-like protein|uniref:lytic transglycosylase domain-containing protein n=1 Tax=Collimonas sp. TaxID=1963772 RepID=UPI002C1A3CE1|nr:lytic transglycosylase domain-containing protein [Collimonas sp.]HWW03795.1 lytic transglycosylase domain-containing protein [Collimonas sp.]